MRSIGASDTLIECWSPYRRNCFSIRSKRCDLARKLHVIEILGIRFAVSRSYSTRASNGRAFWFADHYLPPPGRKEEEHLTAHEGFTVAAAVAGFSKNLRIGHLVLGNSYRNPGLVAKMATTVDQISHGRFVLGIALLGFNVNTKRTVGLFPA